MQIFVVLEGKIGGETVSCLAARIHRLEMCIADRMVARGTESVVVCLCLQEDLRVTYELREDLLRTRSPHRSLVKLKS